MKKILTILFLLSCFGLFAYFILYVNNSKTVLEIYSPSMFGIDIDNNKTIDNNEKFCLENASAFSLNPTDEFIDKYSKELNITKNDIISLGFLAEDFTQKTILNKNITLKLSNRISSDCKYAYISINKIDFGETLVNKGFGITVNGDYNKEEFENNLNKARKLNLVILNHHSGKYHTLDCPYGNAARDYVIIPEKQLPENSKPCKICHKQNHKSNTELKINDNIYNIPNVIQPPLAYTDGNIRIYATDFTKNLVPNSKCNSDICKMFVNEINKAKTSIDVAAYGYQNIPAITNALTKAKNRGVTIRYVYDEAFDNNKTLYKDNNVIKNLASKSMSDRTSNQYQSNKLMHNKFVIIDKSILITGSINLSETGFSNYDVNNIVVINSKDIANLYLMEFEQMLNGKFHNSKTKLDANRRFKLNNSEIEVYFSPKDKVSTRIIQIIQNAKSYIYMPAFLITHNEISNELINAHKRGIDVRIILDANGTNMKNSKHSILRSAKIPLKTENYAGKLHSKTMIIDDEYLIIGSMNFSNSGENANDENILIIKNKNLTRNQKDFFLYLWTIIPNKYLKYNAKAESKDSIGSCSDGVDNNFNGKIDMQEDACR